MSIEANAILNIPKVFEQKCYSMLRLPPHEQRQFNNSRRNGKVRCSQIDVLPDTQKHNSKHIAKTNNFPKLKSNIFPKKEKKKYTLACKIKYYNWNMQHIH